MMQRETDRGWLEEILKEKTRYDIVIDELEEAIENGEAIYEVFYNHLVIPTNFKNVERVTDSYRPHYFNCNCTVDPICYPLTYLWCRKIYGLNMDYSCLVSELKEAKNYYKKKGRI